MPGQPQGPEQNLGSVWHMQVVFPRSKVVKADCYLISGGPDGLPPLNRLPTGVATAAKSLWQQLAVDSGSRRYQRGHSSQGQAVVVHKLKSGEALIHERLDGWSRKVNLLAQDLGCDVAVVLARSAAQDSGHAQRVLTALALVDYKFDRFRSDSKKSAARRALLVPPRADAKVFSENRKLSIALADGITWTRDLANAPPNVATPVWMAEQARSHFRSLGARVEVLSPKAMAQRGMGGLLAVGAGSSNPPRCVRIRIGTRGTKIALVGKGVTFDTGGISIKPAAAMDEMKYDKSGACAVLGVGRTVAQLKLPIRLEIYVPLAENMLDGSSYRPGDIVECMNGKTVEILNTDAEGRMILADALTWAVRGKPEHIVDYATLTGACVVALGEKTAGLFSDDDQTAEALLDAASTSGEYLWRLPLFEHFSQQIKGHHGDLKNVGPRWGGASTAAAFLKEFGGDAKSWTHIDLAGPACLPSAGNGRKEATGYGVALTVQWLRSLSG